jgi:hypothetical protein
MKKLKTDLDEMSVSLSLAKEMIEMTVSHYQAACKQIKQEAQPPIALMAMLTAMIATTAEIAVFINKGYKGEPIWTKDNFADVAGSYFEEALKSEKEQTK